MSILEFDQKQIREISLASLTESSKRNFLLFHGRQRCVERAKTKPLPGPAAGAFIHGGIVAAGKNVQRVMPIHFIILQALDSPLLKMIENAMTKKSVEVDYSERQQWELCHVFTCEPRSLRRTFKDNGISKIKSDAESFMESWTAAEINIVMLAILEQVKRHIETTVKFAAEMEAKGDVSFFREPEPRALTLKA